MKPKISVFIASSLDGYIAREDGSIDWLDSFNATVPSGEDCGYRHFINTIDTIVMGRKSFEKVCEFDQWPYDKPVIVLSSQLDYPIPEHLKDKVTITSETPKTLIQRLASEQIEHVYLDGGKTIQSFLQEDLIDELTITIIPILLGSGCSLFGWLSKDVRLNLLHCRSYDFGCAQLIYQVL